MRFRGPVVIFALVIVAIAISVMSAPTTPATVSDQSLVEQIRGMQAEIASLHKQVAADEKKLAAVEDTANKARTIAGLVEIAYNNDMPALKPLPAKVQALQGLSDKMQSLNGLPDKVQALEQDYKTHTHELRNSFGFLQQGNFKYVTVLSVDALKRPTSPPVHE